MVESYNDPDNSPAYGDVKRKSLEWKIWKFGTNLVRHRDFADRETDGAISLEIHVSKATTCVCRPSMMLNGLITSTNEAIKLDYNVAKTQKMSSRKRVDCA